MLSAIARFFIFACCVLALPSCVAERPNSDLVDLSKKLADENSARVKSVGRSPDTVALSDREYTFVDLDPATLGSAPYYLDLDVRFDTATIWTQADIDCTGCDPSTKASRAQDWDIKIHGRDISLNTNRLVDGTNLTEQAVAATNFKIPLDNFSNTLSLNDFSFLPQTPVSRPKLSITDLIDGTPGGSFGNTIMIRTTRGDRIIYFELVEAGVAPNWVLFNVREQVLGVDTAFKPPKRLFLKWGKDAVGSGIMQEDETGRIRAYLDFDACFSPDNKNICFSDDINAPLNSQIVDAKPIKNWDVYVELLTGSWNSGAFVINGGASRDEVNNSEFDAAALYLGQLKGLGQTSFDKSMRDLWGFSSMQEFWRKAPVQKEFEQASLGADGNNEFYHHSWYQVEQSNGEQVLAPNFRVYVLATTENEGVLFQITQTDAKGNIKQVAYRGATIKQPRQFNIAFRQTTPQLFKCRLPSGSGLQPLFALDSEIVDAETGLPLASDEFALIKVNIQRIDASAYPDASVFKAQQNINQVQASNMARTVNGKNFITAQGSHRAVFLQEARTQCDRGDDASQTYEISARLPGENLHIWNVTTQFCYE